MGADYASEGWRSGVWWPEGRRGGPCCTAESRTDVRHPGPGAGEEKPNLTPRLQAGGILPHGPPAVGPLDHPGLALIGWARGSVYRQPSLWRREPGGEGGAVQELVAGRAKPWDPHA